jgi:acyl-coenzyme A thioesterase PaaI-like protein
MTELPWAGTDFQLPQSTTGVSVSLCGGCARAGACRLGLGQERLLEDGTTETNLVCAVEHEGGPNVAHGGWTAGVFDEVLGHVPMLHKQLAVTGQLTVTYVKPVPIGRPLHAVARIDKREEKRWYVSGELILSATGAVLGRAEAVMVLRDQAHFDRHRQWLAEQDALSTAQNPSD